MPPIFETLWQFFTTNPLGQTIVATVVGGLLVEASTGLFRKLFKKISSQLHSSRPHIDMKVLEVIEDQTKLLPKIFGQEDNPHPLAHHRIPYQPRDPTHDIQNDLRSDLNLHRYLLIKGRRGVGKTREAVTLAQSFMKHDGYRIVWVKKGWIDGLGNLPTALGERRRCVLIFLDDLCSLFRNGDSVQPPQTDKMPLLWRSSYHDRLLRMLDTFEKMCGESEIRVIATAGSEYDEWDILKYEAQDPLWKRFKLYDLAEPHYDAIVNLLREVLKITSVRGNDHDLPTVAKLNDGTFMNVVKNLKRLYDEQKPVTPQNYNVTLPRSLEREYKDLLDLYPVVIVQRIYDAIDILRQSRIGLYPWIIAPVAVSLSNTNWLERLINRQQIRRVIRDLVYKKRVIPIRGGELIPDSGQIEARGTKISWQSHVQSLQQLLLDLADRQPEHIELSLWGFGLTLYEAKEFSRAKDLWEKLTKIKPEDSRYWVGYGMVLSKLKSYEVAEKAYFRAIKEDSNDATPHNGLGVLLQELGNLPEAEKAYSEAIAKDPNDATAHYNLSLLQQKQGRLSEAVNHCRVAIDLDSRFSFGFKELGSMQLRLGRIAEAEATCGEIIAKNPNDAVAYYHLGIAKQLQDHLPEAEEAYRQSIAKNPNYAKAHAYLGALLRRANRPSEAISHIQKAYDLDAHYATLLNLAGAYRQLGDEAKADELVNKARTLIPVEDWYNRARLEVICGNMDTALENLQHAVGDAVLYYKQWAVVDPNLEALRKDARFWDIIATWIDGSASTET